MSSTSKLYCLTWLVVTDPSIRFVIKSFTFILRMHEGFKIVHSNPHLPVIGSRVFKERMAFCFCVVICFALFFIMFCFIQQLKCSFIDSRLVYTDEETCLSFILSSNFSHLSCHIFSFHSLLNIPTFKEVLLIQTLDSLWNLSSALNFYQHHLNPYPVFLKPSPVQSSLYWFLCSSLFLPSHPTQEHRGYLFDMQILLFHYTLSNREHAEVFN